MLLSILSGILSSLIYIALHPTNSGSFPPPLTPAEEADLLRRMEKGEKLAREKLIEHNLRLVAHIVKKYYNGQVEQDDLISIGTIGLIKAISTFNSAKGIRLATYAARCIENEILMYFRNIKKSSQNVSFSDPIDTDKEGNDLTLMDVISDEGNVVDQIDLKIKIDNLKKYIDEVLTGRERLIIRMRYGLIDGKENTQREVAKKLKISRSYVSRLEKKALIKLFQRFNNPK